MNDEWSEWRGRIVGYQHHTYCDHDKGRCTPRTDGIPYVIVGGNAARYIRKAEKAPKHLLVLVPITCDTDKDSFVFVEYRDVLIERQL